MKFLVCWKAGEEHAKSGRSDRMEYLQGTWRQGVGEASSSCWNCLQAPLLSMPLQQPLSHLCQRGHARPEGSQTVQKCHLWWHSSVLTQLQSLAPGESLLGAHSKIRALHYLVLQGRAARRAECCKTESAVGASGSRAREYVERRARQKKERHSECRCILKIHFHHLFLKASVNSFKFHWNLIHIRGIFTFVHWLGVLQKDEKLFLLFLHIDLF